MAVFGVGVAAIAFFALIGLSFISVSSTAGQCHCYHSHGFCCGDDCVSQSCLDHFCRRDWDCSNNKDKLVCCANKCVFGSSCAGRSCSLESDCSVNQACCHSKCVQGINCAGQRCVFDSDCSVNQACCYSKCVTEKNCLGQPCDSHSDCSSGQSCCNGKCKSGLSCIGEPCSSKSDCQVAESCCRETCSEDDCVNIAYIGIPVAVFVLLFFFLIYRRYSRRRKLMAANNNTKEDSTELFTEGNTTSISEALVTQSNPVYQP